MILFLTHSIQPFINVLEIGKMFWEIAVDSVLPIY